jgi:ABC-2 type transport system permease protein
MALPITTWQAVTGKFLAAWLFMALALILTIPIWITVNMLGHPDNGVVLASYAGSFLMAGAFLALSSCVSALTKSQVIAFVISVGGCFFLMISGLDWTLGLFRGWAPGPVVDLIASFSFLTHFGTIAKGLLDIRGVVFFLSLILLFLFINSQIIDIKKA